MSECGSIGDAWFPCSRTRADIPESDRYGSATYKHRPQIFIGAIADCLSPTETRAVPKAVVGVDVDGTIKFIVRSPDSDELFNLRGLIQQFVAIQTDGMVEHEKARLTDVWMDADIILPTEPDGSFFFPGFVDTHIHAPQFPNSGVFGKSTLLNWLVTYTFPLEATFKKADQAERVYRHVVRRLLENGTTTAAYFATIHTEATNILADTCLSLGQRAVIGRVCMDSSPVDYYQDESAAAAVEKTLECVEHIEAIDPSHSLVRAAITPRFAVSCTDTCLGKLGQLYDSIKDRTGCLIQTHVSENKAEIDLVAALFPARSSYTDVYDHFGLLTDRTVLAHAVHVTDDEIKLIKQRKAKVSHCPISNSALSSGIAPVKKLMAAGIDVGLGTDVSGGYSASILATARHAVMVSNHLADMDGAGQPDRSVRLSTNEALYLATVGGAKTLGLDNQIGRFEVGMKWDAQLVRLNLSYLLHPDEEECRLEVPVDLFGTETFHNVLDKWLYSGDDRNTAAVWINGRFVRLSPKPGHFFCTTRMSYLEPGDCVCY